MKHIIFNIFLIWSSVLFSQTQQVSVDTKMTEHPRLLLLKGAEKDLLKNINKDPYWREMHTSVLAEADKMLDLPYNDRKLIGIRLLDVCRDNLRRIFFLSYAYRMTRDQKYSDRAEAEMLHIAEFQDWNPRHFLDVAEMTLAMAIGYDWNYDRLSPKSRKIISESITEKGLKPSMDSSHNYWLKEINNWNQVCNTGITMGALAVYEENPAMSVELLNRAIHSLPNAMKEYGPDGAYPEGVGYWGYGTSFNTIFLDAMDKIYHSDFGLTKTPGFMATGLFLQHMITPAMNPFCYSDAGQKCSFESTVFWFYAKTKNPALLYNQKKFYEADINKKYLRERLFPIALLWGAGCGASLSKVIEPTDLMWVTQSRIPVAAMRSSWTNENAIYFGFKGGSALSGHAHMDAGSFFFEADGVRWGLDLGMQKYEMVEKEGVDLWNFKQNSTRWDVYRYNNFVHNTLTLNDQKQLVNGSADIATFSKDPELMYVTSNLTSVYGNDVKDARRAVALVEKSYVLIEDKILTLDHPVKLRWNMTTEATKMERISGNVILLRFGKKKLFMKVEGVNELIPYFKPATASKVYESPNPGISLMGFETTLPENSTQLIRVFLMPEKEINITKTNNILN
ncbi:MAG: heparinase II/III family protein [Paludibacter sp.]